MSEVPSSPLPAGAKRIALAGGGDEVICQEEAVFLDIGGTRLLSMRTPMGDAADRDWALGFLASEGVIEDISEIKSIEVVRRFDADQSFSGGDSLEGRLPADQLSGGGDGVEGRLPADHSSGGGDGVEGRLPADHSSGGGDGVEGRLPADHSSGGGDGVEGRLPADHSSSGGDGVEGRLPADHSSSGGDGVEGRLPADQSQQASASPAKRAKNRGQYASRRLPHIDNPEKTQFITFRLADSLPQGVERSAESELVDQALDQGLGECVLKRDDLAKHVEDALRFFDGQRYRLLAWCIMPNHVHVVARFDLGYSMSDVIHSWKSYSANKINSVLASDGPLWQRDYFDRYTRDEDDLSRVLEYVVNNPVSAGLCSKPEDWNWSWALGWKPKAELGGRLEADPPSEGRGAAGLGGRLEADPPSSRRGAAGLGGRLEADPPSEAGGAGALSGRLEADPPADDPERDVAEVRVELWRPSNVDRLGALSRTHEMRASCGLCGVTEAEHLIKGLRPLKPNTPTMSLGDIGVMIDTLRQNQPLFDATGGSHGVAILDSSGEIIALAEDIGRHNALDRAIGQALQQGTYFDPSIAVLSGRAGYELVIKAVRVGIPMILSIGAASSFAVEIAEAAGATLVGFIRSRHGESPKRAHIYCGEQRIVRDQPS